MDDMSRRGYDPLNYRFENQVPKPGQATEVADGVYWIRMPMNGRLNHVNVWLLRDKDGWTVVDTGLFEKSVQDHWREVFGNYLQGKPVTPFLLSRVLEATQGASLEANIALVLNNVVIKATNTGEVEGENENEGDA